MRITAQFFSQLRDIADTDELALDLPDGSTAADLLAHLYERFPKLEKWDASILVGIGVDFVDRNHIIQSHDQIAIMPPVQGG
ncbi:MAG: MoaD/ThiS family protein [Chthoniobacterales bacterium]|jgi:molybdopterin converting factor small subunit